MCTISPQYLLRCYCLGLQHPTPTTHYTPTGPKELRQTRDETRWSGNGETAPEVINSGTGSWQKEKWARKSKSINLYNCLCVLTLFCQFSMCPRRRRKKNKSKTQKRNKKQWKEEANESDLKMHLHPFKERHQESLETHDLYYFR